MWQNTMETALWAVVEAPQGQEEPPSDEQCEQAVWCGGQSEEEHVLGWLSTYVDDLLMALSKLNTEELLRAVRGVWTLSGVTKVSAKEPGKLVYCGMEATYKADGTIVVGQEAYIKETLSKFGLEKCNPSKTPAEARSEPVDAEAQDHPEYARNLHEAQTLVGSLNWISCRTRPDIVYAVSMAASLVGKAPTEASKRAKRVMRYLAGTPSHGILMSKFQDEALPTNAEELLEMLDGTQEARLMDKKPNFPPLYAYGDASHAPEGERSHGGIVVRLGSSTIAWRSGRQSMVAESSAEAELLTQSLTSQMALGLRDVLQCSGGYSNVAQYTDSRAVLGMVGHGGSWRSRHYSIRASALRDRVVKGLLTLNHQPTKEMIADLLTKSMPSPAHVDMCERVGLRPMA